MLTGFAQCSIGYRLANCSQVDAEAKIGADIEGWYDPQRLVLKYPAPHSLKAMNSIPVERPQDIATVTRMLLVFQAQMGDC